MATKVRRSSRNVFRDLGFPDAEAESLRIRSELMARLRSLIEKEDLFSIDALVNMLARAGLRVTLTARARTRAA